MPSLGDISSAVGSALSSGSNDANRGQPSNQSTRIIACFYSDEGYNGVVDWKLKNPKKPPPFHIHSLTTRKLFGAVGTWSLEVKAHEGKDLMRLWEDPEDVWVRIAVVRNGLATEVVFGLVSTITESMTRSEGGVRSVEYTIEGLDWQKVLDQTHLFHNLYSPQQYVLANMMRALKDTPFGSPDQIVRALLKGWLGNEGNVNKQWMLPKGLGSGSFWDLLAPRIELGGGGSDLLSPSQGKLRGNAPDGTNLYRPDQWYGYGLWDLLEEWSNGLLNEMFCTLDVGDRSARSPLSHAQSFDPKKPPQPRFVLRERPWPSKLAGARAWNKLRTHHLLERDVQQRQISKGAPESRFNYWVLNPQGIFGQPAGVLAQLNHAGARSDGSPGSYPIFSTDSLKKHGLRQFSQASRYLPYVTDTQASYFRQTSDWLKLLHDWYGSGPYELAGTLVTTNVAPLIQIGERLTEHRRTGKPVTYYVEGVSHTWRYPGPGITVLNVTRGAYEDRQLLDIIYENVAKDVFLGDARELSPVEQIVDEVFPGAAPHGSGVRKDKIVGQIEPPEVVYLKKRGIAVKSSAQARGELDSPDGDTPRGLSPGDLPDQVSSDEDLVAAGRLTLKPERTQNGSLTQRQLEQGMQLPVKEQGQTPNRLAAQDLLVRRRGAAVRGRG